LGVKRKDESKDPPELQVPADNVKNAAQRGYKLLEGVTRIPGHNTLGEFETDRLAKWLAAVRQSCAELTRKRESGVGFVKRVRSELMVRCR
jgi:hypothetical protein